MDEKIEILNSELTKFNWDSKEDLVLLKKEQIVKVLIKFLNEEIGHFEVQAWAEAIECREDIGFEIFDKKLIKQIIFDLANPDLEGILTKDKAKTLIKVLDEKIMRK